jgi:hypothetical protein
MANDWKSIRILRADEFPSMLRRAGEQAGVLPTLFTSLDADATTVLAGLDQAVLKYNPRHIEMIAGKLGEKITTCYEIRNQAYSLADEAFREVSDFTIKKAHFEAAKQSRKNDNLYKPSFLANAVTIAQDGGKFSGSSNNEFWGAEDKILGELETAISDNLEAQRARLEDRTDSRHYNARRLNLKQSFDIELKDAYSLARSLEIGLKDLIPASPLFALPALPAVGSVLFVDELVIWFRLVMITFKQFMEKTNETIIMIPFHNGTEDFSAANPAFMKKTVFEESKKSFTFNLVIDDVVSAKEKLENSRIRGIDVWFSVDDNLTGSQFAFNGVAEFPKQPSKFSPFDADNKTFLHPVRHISYLNSLEMPPCPKNIWGAPVSGNWEFNFDAQSVRTSAASKLTDVTNLYLRLRLMWWRG